MRRVALALAALSALTTGSAAQTSRVVPETRAAVQLSFSPVVKAAAPSVVNVYGARVERTRRSAAMDEYFRRFFGDGPSAPRDRTQRSLGSGVIVDASGLVVTNHHVIAEMTEVRVALADNREIEAEIVLRDPRTDLAVLRLKPTSGLKAMEFGDDDALEVGDLVLAIGNPFGVGRTVTQGIVSGLARTNVGVTDYGYFIQTDAAINPGNSGGALVDMAGRLVGINSAIFSNSGGSVGIGFAIPASMVRIVVDSAKAGSKTVRRPYLGASLQPVDQILADGLGLDRPSGALVSSVREGAPAEIAGLKRGDVILEVGGRPINDPDGFGWRFALNGTSGEVPVTINRAGARQVVTVRLQLAPETPPRDEMTIRVRSPFAGVTVVNASPAVAEEMQLDASEGVVVAAVEDGSLAARVGLQKGDVLLSMNGERIASTRDLDRMARRGAPTWRITINRKGQVMTSVLGG
jgi:Do/DeqQ family serine protease